MPIGCNGVINGHKDGGKSKVKLIEISQKDMIIFLREKSHYVRFIGSTRQGKGLHRSWRGVYNIGKMENIVVAWE
jgi:hypothetical protein